MSSTQEAILAQILKDREQRTNSRELFSAQGFSSVSLNFNIPGYPKTDASINKAFERVVDDLKDYLVAQRITAQRNKKHAWSTPCGDFFIQAIDYSCSHAETKELLEQFEMMHPLGRLLDVDLFVAEHTFISSGKAKKCFLCENTALVCMQEKKHTYAQYKNHISELVDTFIEKNRRTETIDHIATKALQATLLEVSLEHKPGLICPSSNGAHDDMDYTTFLSSSSTLVSHWRKMATYGYDCGKADKDDYQKWKINLRMMGVRAEKDMLATTNGVNTQKGIIFLLGLGVFASGVSFARQQKFESAVFRKTIKKVMQGVVEEDFGQGKALYGTHGEICYKNYGGLLAGGARQEAEKGFPTVFSFALDFLQSQIGRSNDKLTKSEWQHTLLDLLLLIISKSSDTNILYRRNREILQIVQCKAARVLKLNTQSQKQEALNDFCDYCIEQNISPGGTADLLALTLFVYLIEGYEWK